MKTKPTRTAGTPESRAVAPATVTAEELAEINRLDADATPGPWEHDDLGVRTPDRGGLLIVRGETRTHGDAAFIARARTLLPHLAAAHRETIADRDALAAKVEKLITREGALTETLRGLLTIIDEHEAACRGDKATTAALAAEALWKASAKAKRLLDGPAPKEPKAKRCPWCRTTPCTCKVRP